MTFILREEINRKISDDGCLDNYDENYGNFYYNVVKND